MVPLTRKLFSSVHIAPPSGRHPTLLGNCPGSRAAFLCAGPSGPSHCGAFKKQRSIAGDRLEKFKEKNEILNDTLQELNL